MNDRPHIKNLPGSWLQTLNEAFESDEIYKPEQGDREDKTSPAYVRMCHQRILDGLVASALGSTVEWRRAKGRMPMHAEVTAGRIDELIWADRWYGTSLPVADNWRALKELIKKRKLDVYIESLVSGEYEGNPRVYVTVGTAATHPAIPGPRFVGTAPLDGLMLLLCWLCVSALGAFDDLSASDSEALDWNEEDD